MKNVAKKIQDAQAHPGKQIEVALSEWAEYAREGCQCVCFDAGKVGVRLVSWATPPRHGCPRHQVASAACGS